MGERVVNFVLAIAWFVVAGGFVLAGRASSLPTSVARVGTVVSLTLGLFALLTK